MLKKWFARAVVALGLSAVMMSGSTAKAGFTLQDLINGTYSGPTTTGHDVLLNGLDFVFNANSYIATNGGSPPPAASAITVTGLSILGVDTLQFNGGWFAPNLTYNDTSIAYEVKVLSGDPITDLHLSVTGGTSGSGYYSVDDTAQGATVGGVQIPAFGVASDGSSSTVKFIDPTTDIFVTKDIFLSGGTAADPGSARLSVIGQGYSRSGRHVPEPASFALVGLGMLATGIVAYRRRKMAQ